LAGRSKAAATLSLPNEKSRDSSASFLGNVPFTGASRHGCGSIASLPAPLTDGASDWIIRWGAQTSSDTLRRSADFHPSTLALTREISVGRAILDRRAIHIADCKLKP
jgi:hypothetical protein